MLKLTNERQQTMGCFRFHKFLVKSFLQVILRASDFFGLLTQHPSQVVRSDQVDLDV